MRYDYKINKLNEEIQVIRRDLEDGIKISEDTRKSLIFDIKKITSEDANRRLTNILAIIAILVGLLSYIGYDYIVKAAAARVYEEEYNPRLMKDLKNAENRLQSIISEGKMIEERLTEKEKKLLASINEKRDELKKLTKMIASFEIKNNSIENVINENMLLALKNYDGFVYVDALGLSDITLLKTLVVYGELDLVDINDLSISSAVSNIQKKFELKPDGDVGPCTSLLFASIALRYFPSDTQEELKSSLYRENSWYINVMQACHALDKRALRDALDYNDNPLYYDIGKVAELIGIHRTFLSNMLASETVDSTAYHVLDILKKRGERISFETQISN